MNDAPVELTDLDRAIWENELSGFVPQRIFDVHTHLYDWSHFLSPTKEASPYADFVGNRWRSATRELADRVDATLMPGRTVERLSFPFPFPEPFDFRAANEFLAAQLSGDKQSAGLMLVHPRMTETEVHAALDAFPFVGFKPYRNYALSGDIQNCSIRDFMPEHLIRIADARQLLIMMHVSKRDAIADADNIRDLVELCTRYPRSQWILAHCARSYSAWAIEAAASRLRELPNVWYDVSSVCETDAMVALLQGVGPERVMYGSDDVPVGVLRGKYIAFGRAWAYLSEGNHRLNLQHCDSRMTFTRYEQLRAMRRAAKAVGLEARQIAELFYGTARALVDRARGKVSR